MRARHRAGSGGQLRGGGAANDGEPRDGHEEDLSREGETGKHDKVQDRVIFESPDPDTIKSP